MAFVMKFFRGVRNHWKKSLFAAGCSAYGISYFKESQEIDDLMRTYCEEALKYGHQPIDQTAIPKSVTVILNPNANKRRSLKEFEKYCAPILNLSGFTVDIIQTESEGHARTIIESIKATDAVVVAGGDGTVSEVITGMFRADNAEKSCPIGILPLGANNMVGKFLQAENSLQKSRLSKAQLLAEAAISIVREVVRPVDVMRIDPLESEDGQPSKPIFAVGNIEWGAYRDAIANRDKYWYFGSLRDYAAFVFSGLKSSLSWHCEALITYCLPCGGCTVCQPHTRASSRWMLFSRSAPAQLRSVVNEHCGLEHAEKISTGDMRITSLRHGLEDVPKMSLTLGPDKLDYFHFVSQGWDSVKGNAREVSQHLEARQIEIKPLIEGKKTENSWFFIDSEEFEVKPVRVTLLPNAVMMFCKAPS